jgi:CBS domain containing-hemolysin-like protein
MNATIHSLAADMLYDELAVVELIEEIQAAGGERHKAMTQAIANIARHPSTSQLHHYGANMLHRIIAEAALARAKRELEAVPC